MTHKAGLIKIKALRLHHCCGIQATVSLGFHLLMDKERCASIYILSGGGGERMGIMLSRDTSAFSDVNRGHVYTDIPNHTQRSESLGLSLCFSFALCLSLASALKSVSCLDDDVGYTKIS